MIKSMRRGIITNGILTIILSLFGCSEGTKQNNSNQSIYTPLTEQIIDTTSDDILLEIIFANLSDKLQSGAYNKLYETVTSWNKSRQAIYMTCQLEAEVNNGGYDQFYFNNSGLFYKDLPGALRLIGATKYADLTERANDTFEKEKSKIDEDPDGITEGFNKYLEDLPLYKFDKEFYKLNKNKNLQQIQVNYIRKNKKEFID